MNAHQHSTVATTLGQLHVRTLGSGPIAVLWHSLFVDSTTWQRVTGPLSARRRLILIDGPGHGRSAPARRLFTVEECADAAAQVLDNFGRQCLGRACRHPVRLPARRTLPQPRHDRHAGSCPEPSGTPA
jgi:pimeloyl-ACP methyl ester carboxylesterase